MRTGQRSGKNDSSSMARVSQDNVEVSEQLTIQGRDVSQRDTSLCCLRAPASCRHPKWRRVSFMWILLFLSSLSFTLYDVETWANTPINAASAHKIVTTLIVALWLCPLLLRNWQRIFRQFMLPFFLLDVWRLLSSFWSVQPLWSVYRSGEHLVVVGLAAYSASISSDIKDVHRLMNLILTWYVVQTIAVWLGVIAWPTKALVPTKGLLPYMLVGVLPRVNSNTVAQFGGLLALVSA